MITKSAINTLLQITSFAKQDAETDVSLQIININIQTNQKNNTSQFDLYTCTLGDDKYSYSGFILPRATNEQEPKIGDIIKITKISTSKLTIKGCKIIIIKNYSFVSKGNIINNSLISVESYEEIQQKIKEDNYQLNDNETNEIINILNFKEPNINILNFDDVNMKNIIALSQISSFTKNINLYVKIIKIYPQKSFFNKIIHKNSSLISFDIMDNSGFKMQAAIFDGAIAKFENIIKEGNIYYIKGGYAKLNDKRYTSIKADYRLIFDVKTEILKIDSDKIFIKKNGKEKKDNIKITKICDLKNCKKFDTINCVGIIINVFNTFNKNSKIENVSMKKIILGDSSLIKVQMTLWKKFTKIYLKQGDYVLLKNIRVVNYKSNICLSTIDNSIIIKNPENNKNVKELDEIKNLISEGISEDKFKYMTENGEDSHKNKNLSENKIVYLKNLLQKMNDNPNSNYNFIIKATVLEFEHNNKNFYIGCPNKLCKKKLAYNDKKWYCKNCNNNINDNDIEYYYTLTLNVIDLTKQHGINFFGEIVENLFGVDAKTYSKYIEANDIEKLKGISQKIEYHTFYFSGKANIFNYGRKSKKQLLAYTFQEENLEKEKYKILEDIKKVLKTSKIKH